MRLLTSLVTLVFVSLCSAIKDNDGPLWSLDRGSILDEYVANPKPVIAIDIDDTLTTETWFDVIFLVLSPLIDYGLLKFTQPLNSAVDVLTALVPDFHLVLITARPSFLAEETLSWLDENDFPRMPLFTTARLTTFLSGDETAQYKTDAVQYLLDRGLSVDYGIGNAPTDIKAFGSSGATTILILDGPRDDDLGETLSILDLDTYPAAGLDLVIIGQGQAWDTIQAELSS